MLAEKDLKRLVDLLGQTGSDSDPVKLTAINMANEWLRDQNSTWKEILSHRRLPSRTLQELDDAKAEVERLKRELEGKVPKPVIKDPRGKRACAWCHKKFTPRTSGRPPLYCSESCRQTAYQKRKWNSEAKLAEEHAKQLEKEQMKRRLEPGLRQELIAEFVQSGIIHITSPDHIDSFVAGRNDYSGIKAVYELEEHYRDIDNQVGLAAIAKWKARK